MISIPFLLILSVLVSSVVSFSTLPARTDATSSCSLNTLSDSEIIQLAKDYVTTKNGFYAPIDRDAHSADFVFRGGVVGPLNKEDYCTTMTKLSISEAFDLSPNAFGFCIDPDCKNMARFYVRYSGKQAQNWDVKGTPIDIPVSSEPIVGPTESFCIQFDDDGKTKFFTISAPMLFGNPKEHTTGQMGAVLGLFNHVGLNVAADSAMNQNVRTISNAFANLLPSDVAPPKTKSSSEDMPSWWINGHGE